MKGRKLTTGKYSTREELVQNVHFYYHHTKQNISQVAKTTGVSVPTVNNILEPKVKKVKKKMNKDTQIKQLEESNARMKADIEAQAKLIAELTVSNKRERVARGETYWHLATGELVNSDIDYNNIIDLNRFKRGNYYCSKAEAQLASDKAFAQQRIFDTLREHEGDWELKFSRKTSNTRIYFHHTAKQFHHDNNDVFQEIPDSRWYSSEESCQWVIANMENDLKICFGVE